MATIVTAYLIGLGVGSWLGAGLTRKFSAQQAVWLVIGLELAIGAYAVASPVLLYDLLYWKFGWLYRNFWLAAILHLATLVIPTMFMGSHTAALDPRLAEPTTGTSQITWAGLRQ